MDIDFNQIHNEVEKVLGDNKNGHAMDHVENVLRNAEKIALSMNDINLNIIKLSCLLHDVDDYKIVGIKEAKNKTNSKRILSNINISEKDKTHILEIIDTMGYSNYLNNIRPNSIEGKIVSDADMLDAIGVNGIIRSIVYNASHGYDFFRKDAIPRKNISKDEYQNNNNNLSTVNHFFEKLLLIKDIMLTKAGMKLAKTKHEDMLVFLKNYFIDNNHPEWLQLLEEYK
ncbi:MAG: HD domain-containing protein [Alphaproteobacteria bacterium]|jgi:uncharacterized protein|nr:HD domain-containing protein [Alphaproteobacteria bacterium]